MVATDGDKIRKIDQSHITHGQDIMSAQMLEASLFGVGTVLHLDRDTQPTVMAINKASKK